VAVIMRFLPLVFLCVATPAAAGNFLGTDLDGSLARLSEVEIESISRALEQQVRDPVSLQYRMVQYSSGERQIICGQFNAKNGFGGYAGFRLFALVPTGGRDRSQLYLAGDEKFEGSGCRPSGRESAKPATASPPASLLKVWTAENLRCRRSSGADPMDRSCERRSEVSARLNAIGWCYGRQNEIGAEYDWHRCGPTSYKNR
jgi:hypothetical protein